MKLLHKTMQRNGYSQTEQDDVVFDEPDKTIRRRPISSVYNGSVFDLEDNTQQPATYINGQEGNSDGEETFDFQQQIQQLATENQEMEKELKVAKEQLHEATTKLQQVNQSACLEKNYMHLRKVTDDLRKMKRDADDKTRKYQGTTAEVRGFAVATEMIPLSHAMKKRIEEMEAIEAQVRNAMSEKSDLEKSIRSLLTALEVGNKLRTKYLGILCKIDELATITLKRNKF